MSKILTNLALLIFKIAHAVPMLENRGKVCINRKYGFVDWEGHEIIKIQYDSVSHFNVHKQAQVWKQNDQNI